MDIRKVVLVGILAGLGGCATCQTHPVACAIGGALIVGSVAATVAANTGHDHSGPDLCGPSAANRSNAVIGSCVGR